MNRHQSILAGMGKIFDFSGSYGRVSLRRMRKRHEALMKRSDSEALASDWEKVGNCLRKALNKAEYLHGPR